MKKTNLFLGVLFSLLMTMPSYAQRNLQEQKQNKTKLETLQKKKSQNMKVLTEESKMEQTNPNLKQNSKAEEVQETVTQGTIDPRTGERNPSGTRPFNENDISITYPYNENSISLPLNIKGETKKNSRVKVIISKYNTLNKSHIGDTETIFTESDNDGKWEINFSDYLTSNVTYKITAVRIGRGDETGGVNTAAVTVYYTLDQGPNGAVSSSGK